MNEAYNIFDTGFNKLLSKSTLEFDSLSDSASDLQVATMAESNFFQTSPSQIGSGELVENITMIEGFLRSSNFVSGVSGWNIASDGSVEFNNGVFRGSLIAASIHIPNENTTADSFHSDGYGNSWWGCTQANFTADNDNAKAFILKTGVAKFQSITLETAVIIKDLQAGSVVDGQYINSLNVSKLVTGTISSQQITLGVTGGAGDIYIGGGNFNATTWTCTGGFLLGVDDSDSDLAKFFVGDVNSNINFDGRNLVITGVLNLLGTLQLKSYTVANLPIGSNGPKYPTATGTYFDEWTDPTNAYTDDGNYATINSTGLYQDYSGFGFALPTVTIVGIKIEVEGHFTGGTGTPQLYVGMTKNGDWISGEKSAALNLTTDTVLTLGGASDLWGETGWFKTDFNTDGLYVRFKVEGGGGTANIFIDYVRVTVYYNDPQNPVVAGSVAYASNGRKNGEGGGAGTGVLVFYDGAGLWIACDTGTAVAA